MSLPNAFVTLLTTPSYLPGALVLLHSLLELHPAPRDFKTVCIVTPESVDAKVIGELRNAGYDLVIGVEGISSGVTGEDGLNLMGRPDLNMALTKLHLFRLHTLFSTLIYLDADVLPLRPLAHLFSTTNPHVLSACPDTGWPDCFNSGVMVIRPRESDFEGLRALLKNGAGDESPSESGGGFSGNGSFDGADQGLLNEWFSEEGGGGQWNRLPFTYNVTPSAAYTYKPAYHRYGHKINVVHFIGPNKPWANLAGRPPGVSLVKKGKDSYDYPALIDRWYDVYDRNVRPTAAHSPDLKVRFAVPEYVAVWNLASGVPEQPADRMDLDQLRAAAGAGLNSLISGQYISLPLDGRVDLIMPKPKSLQERIAERNASPPKSPTTVDSPLHIHAPLPQTLQQQTQQPATWDGSRYSPPKQGEPEMKIPLDTFYESAWDAPATSHSSYFAQNNKSGEPEYPTLPSSVTGDSWYGAFTKTKPDKKNIQAVFPWEQDGHSYRRPDRVFPRGSTPPPRQDQGGLTVPGPHFVVQQPTPPIPSPETTSSPPSQPKSMADAMASYTNAWDKVPEIQDYVTRITGRKSKGPSHISIRSKDLNGMGLASVPGTPAFEVEGTGRRREISMDRHSEASGDGDDEAGEESDDESSETSRKAKYPGNSNYRDRRVQTDKPSSSDATVQAGPNPGLSPAVATFEIPSRERQSASAPVRVSNTRQQSSSSDTTVRGNPFTPPSVTSPDSTSGVTINFMGQSASFASRNSQSSGNGNGPGKMHDRRTSYSSDQREQVPPAQARPASRIFDPSTDVDVRKRDTQNVLSRFMKVGSFAQSNPDAKQ